MRPFPQDNKKKLPPNDGDSPSVRPPHKGKWQIHRCPHDRGQGRRSLERPCYDRRKTDFPGDRIRLSQDRYERPVQDKGTRPEGEGPQGPGVRGKTEPSERGEIPQREKILLEQRYVHMEGDEHPRCHKGEPPQTISQPAAA